MNEGMPPIGTVLDGRYRIEQLLGRGGMGAVFAARHLQIDEPVAVKVLLEDVARDPEIVARFQREAKAARKIKSEHAVKILDVGALPTGAPFIVMEFLAGTDLDHIVRQAPSAVPTAVDYVLQAMEALAEAHVQGMVHRDLKPANLFVSKRADGSPLVKVLDFGISKLAGDSAELALTKTGAAPIGSPLYMAPEQMRSMRLVDARSDIWALGIILYELLAATPPFNGTSMTELCAAVLQDPMPPLRAGRPDVPIALEDVIRRCLAKDPAARFADVGELAQALAPFAPRSISAERIAGTLREANETAPTAVMAPIQLAPTQQHGTTKSTWVAPEPRTPPPKSGIAIVLASVSALLIVLGIGTAVFITRAIEHQKAPAAESKPTASDDDEKPTATTPVKTDAPVIRNKQTPTPMRTTAPLAFRPLSGQYVDAVNVTITTRTPGAVIRYSTTGEVTEQSTIYTGPIPIHAVGMLKARAFAPDHLPSPERMVMYQPGSRPAGFGLKLPQTFDVAAAACGSSAASIEVPVENPTNARITFTAKMTKGTTSPFALIGAASVGAVEVPAHGHASVQVFANIIAQDPASLTEIADTLEITAGGSTRMVSLHAAATGAALDVFRVRDVDIGDVPVGKRGAQVLYVHNTGNKEAQLLLGTPEPSNFSVSTQFATLRPDQLMRLEVQYAATAPGKAEGELDIAVDAESPLCDAPLAPLTLRAEGTK